MAMTFGIHIGHMGGPLDEMRKLWKFADAHGFDWFSVSDHFQESPPRGGDLDCFEAIATLTAAAVETQRVRLGALVYCVAYRNPGLHAKSLTTIDHLSGGRETAASAPGGTRSRHGPSATSSRGSGFAKTCSRSTPRSCACSSTPNRAARASTASTSDWRTRRTTRSPSSRASPSG